ncbi:MAG: hypothetical protein KKF54_04070 [Candidatus Omnitrophica bacterium]|nr:hypothetical protein [Candidatus Omnitrophota bacterium]
MWWKGFFFALILSLIVHLFVLLFVYPYFNVKKTPLIYCWPSILEKGDIFSRKGIIPIPKGVDLSASQVRQDYFSSSWVNGKNSHHELHKDKYPLPVVSEGKILLKERNDYLYLWERQTAFPANKKEKIPYKVLCADSGKVIFLYPQKLSVDSKKNISVQQYLRESVLSLKEKFSWTKLDGVIE